jgi:hypothetical protein
VHLTQLGPQYESAAVLLTPIDPPKRTVMQQMNPWSAPPDQPLPPVKAPAKPYAGDLKDGQSPSRWMSNPFRRRPAPTPDSLEEAADDVESMPDDSGKPIEKETPKKRNWLWPAPRKLPDEAEAGARSLDAEEPPGRSRL